MVTPVIGSVETWEGYGEVGSETGDNPNAGQITEVTVVDNMVARILHHGKHDQIK